MYMGRRLELPTRCNSRDYHRKIIILKQDMNLTFYVLLVVTYAEATKASCKGTNSLRGQIEASFP